MACPSFMYFLNPNSQNVLLISSISSSSLMPNVSVSFCPVCVKQQYCGSTVCALSLAASLRDDSPRKSNVKLAEMRLEAAAVSQQHPKSHFAEPPNGFRSSSPPPCHPSTRSVNSSAFCWPAGGLAAFCSCDSSSVLAHYGEKMLWHPPALSRRHQPTTAHYILVPMAWQQRSVEFSWMKDTLAF